MEREDQRGIGLSNPSRGRRDVIDLRMGRSWAAKERSNYGWVSRKKSSEEGRGFSQREATKKKRSKTGVFGQRAREATGKGRRLAKWAGGGM